MARRWGGGSDGDDGGHCFGLVSSGGCLKVHDGWNLLPSDLDRAVDMIRDA